jgi:tRNA-2-methylthio-N6-dimethylallyladenosine synthase
MYGCDNFCTYCIVPYTRGKLRSRNKNDILKEVNDLIKLGYKEITLLGQNVNSYGLDKKDKYKFINLLEDVCKTGIARVRFTTSNP